MVLRVARIAAAIGMVIVAAAVAGAQTAPPQPPVTRPPAPVIKTATMTMTSAIQAIDAKARTVTLKHTDGTQETIYCGPEVKRFNELKVGDTVTFTYREAVVMSIAPAGAKAGETQTNVVRGTGDRPGGTVSERMSAIVTVRGIDTAVPSITIQREDGNTASFKVENPKNIAGLKVGDRVLITYTQALAVSVK